MIDIAHTYLSERKLSRIFLVDLGPMKLHTLLRISFCPNENIEKLSFSISHYTANSITNSITNINCIYLNVQTKVSKNCLCEYRQITSILLMIKDQQKAYSKRLLWKNKCLFPGSRTKTFKFGLRNNSCFLIYGTVSALGFSLDSTNRRNFDILDTNKTKRRILCGLIDLKLPTFY